MKLDYLQFLELEMFTRFGAKLEASIEAGIQKGRLLREILKQERLTPQPITFQLAWLIAFNNGLFEKFEPKQIATQLALLETQVKQSTLTIYSPRELWLDAVSQWLNTPIKAASV